MISENAMTDEELKALVASLAIDQKEIAEQLGNIGLNQGDVWRKSFLGYVCGSS